MNDNISKEFDELFTAEFWAKNVAIGMTKGKLTPIQNFEANILKSMILYATSKNISEIWPNINKIINQEKGISNDSDLLSILEDLLSSIETGLGAYFVYTEQALVSSVSATEIYYKDRLITSINRDKRLLLPFSDKQINIKRLIECQLNLKKNIGDLVVEKLNLQDIEEVRKTYQKIYGFYPFSKKELSRLKFIFNSRHIIVHNSGFVDRQITHHNKKFHPGQRLYFDRDEIINMIRFINKHIISLDKRIESKHRRGKK